MQKGLNGKLGADYVRPAKLETAVSTLAAGPRVILAGGTDVFPRLQDRPLLGPVLDISGIAELSAIDCDGSYFRIGAATSWRALINTDLPPAFDGLKEAAGEVGSIQIQNRATVVGNLCNASPAADGVPPLLTLDAEVEIASTFGFRYLPLSKFILGNRKTALETGEMVSALRIPLTSTTGQSNFLKLGARSYLVISISMAALRLNVDKSGMISTVALSIGACSEVAMRMERVESALCGTPLANAHERITQDLFTELAPIDDVRAPAQYRREASVEVVKRLLAGQQSYFANEAKA